MGLTSALNTSLNGLSLNEVTIDVLGNNIANAGTNGFKASNVLFTTQLARTLSVGSRPTNSSGGTNPRQVGLGAASAAILKDFTQGGITNSASPSDLAIQGDGFFIMNGPDGQAFSRNGNFSLNKENILSTATGMKVQGYLADLVTFTIPDTKVLSDIEIPLGQLNAVQATSQASLSGFLRTTEEASSSTQGSLVLTRALTDTSGGTASTDPIDSSTLLTSVFFEGSSTPVFSVGDVVTFAGQKGSRRLETQTFRDGAATSPGTVTATTTVGEWLSFLEGALGITTQADDATIPNDSTGAAAGKGAGVTVDSAGRIQILGNGGLHNDIDLALGDLKINDNEVEFQLNKVQDAIGESTVVDFPTFDSLGSQVNVKLTAFLESRDDISTTYRYIIESDADADLDTVIGTGTLTFDGDGNVKSGKTTTVSIERSNASSNLQFEIDLSGITGIVAFNSSSSLQLKSQNGTAPGTLTNFVIDESGQINGVFNNGIVRTLGQIPLARFLNPQGLLEAGGGSYREGVSSGPAQILTAGENGMGTIRSGSIELSNTDVGRNLVDLIVASTNYRGNARVISSVQQLIDELLILGR
ncbi:MAG: flagellar hook-basal body complex protein [Planctomycetota bacterium]|nr:flagellar hook-basal body complex protein [Planctomycetota bacterium]MDA1211090.1 flagellar hook-basal body complex protein [Planctomycetota bacterium]